MNPEKFTLASKLFIFSNSNSLWQKLVCCCRP